MSESVQDDDSLFTELIRNAAYDRGKSMDQYADVTHPSSVLNFVHKRFGSLNSFYNENVSVKSDNTIDGFSRLNNLRQALRVLDSSGWERSFHQKIFHENFLNAIVKILFKKDPPGSFERAYPRLLELNNWQNINQEILISTPRRFGKTISVCLFVAALLYAAPSIEISIYSTCKRISCKLLKNCTKFLSMISTGMKQPEMPYIKQSVDEVELQGPEGRYDTRKLNSYPSKVTLSEPNNPILTCARSRPLSLVKTRLYFFFAFASLRNANTRSNKLSCPWWIIIPQF